VFLAILVIGLTGLILDWAVGKIQELVTHRRPARS
jgi:nitrate/nitrite transport system permease protein